MKKLLAKIRKILHDRRTRQMLTRIVSVTAAIVVFITTYALVLPAITMESEANCGIEAHQHDESCYEDKLICGEIESPGHHHSEACYEVSKALVCEEQEHQHDDSCFDESGNLTCDQPEHTHDDTCYKESRELTCDIPESDGHQHSSACYERVLTCGKEIHTHSTACYEQASDTATSAPADFAAVATTELGSSGATVSASTEIETESGESDAASSETSDAWTTEKNVEGEASSSTTTNVSTTAATTAGSSSTATAAANTTTASTGNTAFDSAAAENTYIPQLEPVIFEQLLTKDTGIYYYHAEEGQEAPESSADIADWKRVNDNTELTPADLLRVYLRYTIPAGTLNATNDIARYRLPSNLHLTDQQMETINTTVNGVANQYVSLDTLEITDTEKYNTYLGIEATEGTRTPSDDIDKYFKNHPDLEGQEYINAVVRAENVFDDTTGEYAGQDLVFTFSPYTVQKNQHEYDADGQPTKAGKKVDGWLCFDLHMDQIDWSEPVISTIDDSAESIQDNATPTQDESVETAEGSGSSDATEATEITDSETEEETSSSSSDPDALNTNTITEKKKESSAEIIFAAKDKALKIDEISTELHLVEFNAIEAEKDTTPDEQDQSADEYTDSNKSEMTNTDTADDTTSEGEADKNDSADETAATAEDQPESETEINAKTYPAVSFEDTITVQAGTLTTDNETAAQDIPAETAITVSVIAEEETFPLGTTMQLGTVEDMDTVASAVEGAVGGQTRGFHAVDISFHNVDGEEIEPLKPIKVSMTSDAIKQAVEDSSTAPVVVHVENSAEAPVKDKDTEGLPANSTDAEENSVNINLQSDREAEKSENTPIATIVETNESSTIDGASESTETADTLSFDAGSFSVYAIVYTVDFEYSVNGKMYQFSLSGGEKIALSELVEVLGILDGTNFADTDAFLKEVKGVEFSDPALVKVTQMEGDWELESLEPFTTEESLTITMKNGDVITVKVTDAAVTSTSDIDSEKEYILYVQKNGTLYVLKTDGNTVTANYSDLDTMDNDYKWKFNLVYTDSNGVPYYIVRPVGDNGSSLVVDWDTTFSWSNPNNYPLVQSRGVNVTIVPSGNGFKFEGYNNAKLLVENGWFAARRGTNFDPVVIYEPGQLEQYGFYVTSDDYAMGKVCGLDKDGQYKEDSEYDARTNNDKYNEYEIKAEPQTSRYIFDYWDLNGTPIDNGATIPAGTLSIPYQGSRLTAHFKKDPNWQAPDEEKEGRVIDKESFQAWLEELRNRNIPLDQENCTKTAELYDYENRIYRVDLTAKSNLSMFDGDIDLGFIIDVSGSMQFPSKLIPVAGKEAVDVGGINTSYYTQHQLDTNKVYYIIVDRTNTANVLRLKWCDGPNPAYPNHTGWPTGSPSSSSTTWHTGWGISGLGFEESALDSTTRYFTDTSGALFGGDNGPFQIYEAGDNGKKRKEYLESSIAGTIAELNSILGDLAYAQNASEAADVKIAYNTFADAVDYNHTNHNFVSVTSGLTIGYDYKGGTDTEEALMDADDFFWNDSATKVAVLITDGAPQQSGVDGPTLDARVKAAADTLKNQGIKLVTIGLSMGDVKRGSRLLYDIATRDSDGDPYFYKADTGDELQYALYEVIQTVMADAIVVGNVTDTVNEAFYPVDKDTGEPLIAGNVIDLNGIKIANSISGLTDEQKDAGYGVIGQDSDGNYTVTWNGQNFTWDGWHGTVYEKAKEDFLGGNAVRTNDPEKPAMIVSEGYKIHPEDPTIAFKPEIAAQGTKSLETPRVNVNELDLTDASTEWTVYLGTEVDPKSQLEAFYDNILVKEVVTAATDTDGDGFPDRMTGTSLYYPLLESVSDKREATASGEQVTFKMKDLLKKLNNGTDITIDDLIDAGEEGITLPYGLYGQDCPGSIKIKLTKTGDTANYDPHTTTVTGDAVETYSLLVDFAPDYVHLPQGQGGDGSKPYHTGSYGLAYEGNAAGEDYSTNVHVINVYNVPLDVYKTDENGGSLAGAIFKLYKAGGAGTVSGLSGQYTEVASGTSGADGVAHLTFAAGMETGLVPGTIYYLVEDTAPEKYTKVNTVWTVQVQTEVGRFTDLNDEHIVAPDYPTLDKSMYPFNWDQGARIVVDGQPVRVVAKGAEENTTTTITDGSYVSHKAAISFRHTVENVRADTSITVKKTWEDENDPNRPSSVTVKLYRVSEKGHQWYNGTIVPCTCTEDGVKEYTCSVCGAKDTQAIDKAGHKPGDAHRENYQAPTCTDPGRYDLVVRCTVCNAVISSEPGTIPATGHTWVNQETATSDPDHYCYDIADVCSVCGAVNEETRSHHVHDWGAWEVTTPAQPGVAGEETRICRHNPAHVDHREIPALSTDHTVTIYFRCTGNGNGGMDYYGQITEIATRSGTGSGDMTIKWNWDEWTSPKPFDVEGLGTSTYKTSSSGSYNGAEQTLTISNITSDLILYVTIRNYRHKGTDNGLIGQPIFSGNRNLNSRNLNARSLNTASASSTAGDDSNGKSLLHAKAAPKREAEGAGDTATPEVLGGISGLKTKAEAACGDKYWEQVADTYQINASDAWSKTIPDLPKYNEYGKEYTYYVEEVPVTGYDTTYSDQGTTNPEIINTPKTVDLTVTKTWAFADPSNVTKVEGKEWPQGVTVRVVVYSKTGENNPAPTSYTVDLTADRPTYTFTGLPEYIGSDKIEYSVVEAGVTGLDSEHFNTVIEGSAESGYTIKNTEKEAGLTIIKSFEGSELTEAQKNAITFTVTGSSLKDRSTGNSVDRLTKTYAEFTEGQWVLNQSDGIVNGRTYTVTETNGNIEHYSRVTTVKVNDGNAASFVQGGADPSGSITISGYQGTITITNTYTKLANLKIIKVDSNGMETLLEGALFELRKVDPENTTLSYLDDAAKLPATTGEDNKTGTNGEAVFADLAQGYYEVKETEMPAGYVRTGDGVFYIKIENGEVSHVERTIILDDKGDRHVMWTPGSDNAEFIFTASSGENPAIAKVGNEPGVALPHTGGPGTNQIYILGIILTAFAGIGLVMRKNRRDTA